MAMRAAPSAAVKWGSWRYEDIMAPDFLHGLDETHISRAAAHHGHILFNPYSLRQTVDLGCKGPVYSRQKVLFLDLLGDTGNCLRLRKNGASRVKINSLFRF